MVRPKKLKKCQENKGNGISIYAQYREGFNECKKLYDEHIPNEQEIYGILINNGIDELESKEIAKIITGRLKWYLKNLEKYQDCQEI